MQVALLGGGSLLGLSAAKGASSSASLLNALADPTSVRLLFTNGASFYAYLQLSWVCLARMSAVSHSIANSMRRPATIAAALFLSPVRLSALNMIGMSIACVGALLYGVL